MKVALFVTLILLTAIVDIRGIAIIGADANKNNIGLIMKGSEMIPNLHIQTNTEVLCCKGRRRIIRKD